MSDAVLTSRVSNPAQADLSRIGWRFVELAGLSAIAIAQPVFTIFGNGAEELVSVGASALDLIIFTVLLLVVPPAAATAAVELVDRVDERAGTVAFASAAGLFGGLFLMETAKDIADLHALVLVSIGLIGGVLTGWLRFTNDNIGLAFRLLAVAGVVFAAIFLFLSPAATVAFGDQSPEVDAGEGDALAHVVFITLDEFPTRTLLTPDGTIDADLYPNIARLAGDGTWYRNTSGVSPSTPTALPALVTGQLPTELDDVPVAADYPQTMFAALGGSMDLNVWESATQLCPADLCGGSAGSVDRGGALGALIDEAVTTWWDFASPTADESTIDFDIRQSDPSADNRVRQFVTSIGPVTAPRLDFLHVIFPHQPWWRLPTGERYDAPILAEGLDGQANYAWRDDFVAAAAFQRHQMQVVYTDALLGEVFGRLDDLGLYDDALIVLTADHGAAFTPGEPIRGLSSGNAHEVMWVPFIMKVPGQQGGAIDDQPVQTIDVVPTLLDVVGVEVPWDLDGRALHAGGAAPDDVRLFADWSLNRLEPTDGLYVDVDGAAAFEDLLASAHDPVAGPIEERPFRLAPHGHLAFTHAPADPPTSRLRYSLEDPDALETVITGDTTLPAYISGSVGADQPLRVAVAINGTVAGWSETIAKDGTQHFWVIASADLFVDGVNTVDVYELSGDPGDETLRLMASR